ncbi:hypothetical protein GPALN_004574 [Globodera pallida]|nr:hypothetical protein GPALN_004574 [Globodera pallida]
MLKNLPSQHLSKRNVCAHFHKNLAGNPDALTGELRLRLDKFSEFVKEPAGTQNHGDEVNVRGMAWNLEAAIIEMDFAKYLRNLIKECQAANEDSVKFFLAAHSTFFNALFNENGQADRDTAEGWSVNIVPPATVENFNKMIDVLHLGDYVLNVSKPIKHLQFVIVNCFRQLRQTMKAQKEGKEFESERTLAYCKASRRWHFPNLSPSLNSIQTAGLFPRY